MSTDIVERLRDRQDDQGIAEFCPSALTDLEDAADLIEQQRATIADRDAEIAQAGERAEQVTAELAMARRECLRWQESRDLFVRQVVDRDAEIARLREALRAGREYVVWAERDRGHMFAVEVREKIDAALNDGGEK